MKVFNCYIAGVGGQGTVLASKLLAAAAMRSGFNARTTEYIGMAQRGGSVFGHVRIGKEIHSPLIPKGRAHLLLGFDPSEAARQIAFLSEDGKLITADGAAEMVEYLKSAVPDTAVIPAAPIKEKYPKMLNTALLGAAAEAGAFPFDIDALLETIDEMPRFREENLKAFELGRSLYDERA
jgi:indolepyruvate ferredoxin oxidoreductase beta subunit